MSTDSYLTLGDYLKTSKTSFGDDSAAVKFLEEKIAESPNGENQELVAFKEQILGMLVSIHKNGIKDE